MRLFLPIFFVLFLLIEDGYSQSDQLYTMFVFNKLQYNPAYAGANEVLDIGAHYRHQWQGVIGAPRTVTAFAHTPFAEGRSGIGLSLVSDETGLFKRTIGKVDYAYRIGFKNDHKLSLGLAAQVENARFDWNKTEIIDNADTTIPYNESARNAFNIGIGIYYTGPKFYLGVSAPNFMRNAITSDAYSGFGQYGDFRPYYFMSGLIFPVSNNVKIRPSILISYINNTPIEVDFNLSVLFMDKFWIGASYRLNESIDAFVQFPLTNRLKLAVGVDYPTTQLNKFTKGSGEVMIEYLLIQKDEKVNNIRFF